MKTKKFFKQKLNKVSFWFLSGAVIFGVIFGVSQIKAGTAENSIGWLFGGGTEIDGALPGDGSNTNVGWISVNSLNCDSDGDGQSNGIPAYCPPIGTSIANYGVNIPPDDGPLSGYAWSENIGWINFDPGGPYPTTPNYSVTRKRDNLEGWARIVGIQTESSLGNSGGWQGWIKLRGSNYGVSINSDNQLSGYGWSDELGWIDFKRAKIYVPKTIEANITASPPIVSTSTPPTPVSITVNVTGGTATGGIVYELDCDNSGDYSDGKYPKNGTTDDLSYTFSDACTYAKTSLTSVRITRDGVTKTPVTTVVFGCINYDCDTADFSCKSSILISGCKSLSSCQANCQAKRSANWQEVAP